MNRSQKLKRKNTCKEATLLKPGWATSTGDGEPLPGAEKKEATMTRQRPAGVTSTEDGEPLPGAKKTEATTRPRPAGATSTGDGEPLPGALKTEMTRQRPLPGAEEAESRPPGEEGIKTRGEARPRINCLGPKKWNQDQRASWGNLQGGRGKEILLGSKDELSRPPTGGGKSQEVELGDSIV